MISVHGHGISNKLLYRQLIQLYKSLLVDFFVRLWNFSMNKRSRPFCRRIFESCCCCRLFCHALEFFDEQTFPPFCRRIFESAVAVDFFVTPWNFSMNKRSRPFCRRIFQSCCRLFCHDVEFFQVFLLFSCMAHSRQIIFTHFRG